jgi:hypothetical protein
MSISKTKLILIPLAIWIASFGAAEIVFRMLGHTPTTELAGLYEQFGETFKHRPHVKTDANWVGGRFSVITDSEGLRCGEKDANRPATTANDVLVIGDSQTYGQGLSYEDTMVGRLAAAAGPEVTIRNAAVGGHYLEDQFKLARWLYDRGMRPKAAIIFLTPYLAASAGRENHARVGADGRLYSSNESWYSKITLWLKMHTVVYGQVRNAMKNFIVVSDETPTAVSFFAVSKEQDEQTRLRKSLAGFQQWASGHDISVLVVYTPLAIEVDFASVSKAAEAAHVKVDQDMPFRASQNTSAALNLEFYDLRSTLKSRFAQHLPLSLYKDPHYNADTSRASADDVWHAIESSGMLREHSTAHFKEQHGTGSNDDAVAGLHP